MIAKRIILVFIIAFVFIGINNTFAQSNIFLETEKKVEVGEEFILDINVKGDEIYALTINILYDSSKVEFIGNNNDVEVYENRLIYAWFDETGGKDPKLNENIVNLKFKAIGSGEVNFGINGEIYSLYGEMNNINYMGTALNIEDSEIQKFQSDNNNSVLLKELRINYEGINPEFNKEIETYYFTTDEDIKNISVEAIPENKNAKVSIKGNDDIQYGLNKIQIEVSINDIKKNYIIYVTKTNNIELSNANLENLAVDMYYLDPEFNSNITNYNIEVYNDTDRLNILAIPQNINANVDIIGNENLKEGTNKIKIIVNSQDNITKKEYNLNVYKRNVREDIEFISEKQIEIEKLSEITEENIENKNVNNEIIDDNSYQNKEDNKKNTIIIIIVSVILLVIIVFFVIKYIILRYKK